MKKVLAVLAILILAFAGYIYYAFKSGKKKPKGPEPVPLTVSKHSPAFNASVHDALTAYYTLSESLVNWDSAKVKTHAAALQASLDSLKLDELKTDTTGIYESAVDPLRISQDAVATLRQSTTLAQARESFNALSENLRLLCCRPR